MKTFIRIFQVVVIVLIIQSCASKINYLGSYFKPTDKVELFFESKDITSEYRVIGLMNKNRGITFNEDFDEIKKTMIEKAKSVGADAILVTRFGNQTTQKLSEDILTKKVISQESGNLVIEAQFLKYN